MQMSTRQAEHTELIAPPLKVRLVLVIGLAVWALWLLHATGAL
jgi:hypothetical protein